jgi:hypothetical protein
MKTYYYSVIYKDEFLSYESEMDADTIDEIKEDLESVDNFADVVHYEIYSEDGIEHLEWSRE